MRTSGLTLDFYDDAGCEQLKEMFPKAEDVPRTTKTASILSQDDQDRLPDDLFAFVAHYEGQTLRKFACFDSGNTDLSVHYFLKNAHKLPGQAQQQVAQNLKVACAWYGLNVPEELEVIASGGGVKVGGIIGAVARKAASNPIGVASTALTLPSQVQGTHGEIKRNLAATRAAQEATGLSAVTPEQVAHFKGAEVVGTTDMPIQPPSDDSKPKTVAVIKKTGAAQKMDIYAAGREEKGKPDTNEATKGKAPVVAPKMNPHIDVTGKTASLEIPQAFTNYALGDKYPLDSYMHVKTANAYFKEYGMMFSPTERREYCSAVVQRADALGVEVDPMVRKYGSAGYAPDDEIEMALQMRRNVLQSQTALDLLDKMASARKDLPPRAFVEALEEFDKVACINHHWDSAIYDPYFSTYGTSEKTASEKEESFVDNIGNARITGHQLKAVSLTKHLQLRDVFGEDFCDEFKKDPVGIYNSMPREQKLMLINLANDNAPGVRGSIE